MKGAPSKRASGFIALIVLGGGGVFLASLACTQKSTLTPLSPQDSQKVVGQRTATATSADPSLDRAPSDYAEAVRRQDFESARRLLENASAQEKEAPEVRYVSARVALALSDFEGALRAVNRLEEKWPAFSEEAKEVRLLAAKMSHDVTLLSLFLGNQSNPEDQLVLAEAQEKSGSSQLARKLADSVLSDLAKSKEKGKESLEVKARALRARTYESENKLELAAREYRWLATEGARFEGGEAAALQMQKLDPSQKLTPDERLKRAEAFSEQGRVAETQAEIEALKQEAVPPPAWKLESLLAWAYYSSRTDYARAAELFQQAAARPGPDKKRLLYYEAKALARSHRDGEAVLKYETLAKLGGTYAEHAAYQTAHLKFIDGNFKAAVASYRAYLRDYRTKGMHTTEVQHELPVARLAAEDYSAAHSELEQLVKRSDSPRERARLMQLSAVALLGMNKAGEAATGFREVIRYRPLSFAALLAAARLRQMKEEVPPPLAPASVSVPAGPPLALALPDKVWRLNRVGLDREAELALMREESALKKQYGSRSGEALCRMYGQLESAKRRYQIAQTAASWSVLNSSPAPESQWQWDCIYPAPYGPSLKRAKERHDVSQAFIYAIMRQESAFRPEVISPAGAVGLMQIMPATAMRIAEEMNETYDPKKMVVPDVNIGFGTYYLRRLLDMFGGRMELAAASYNAGPQAVTRWLKQGESLPLDIFVARIPYTETRNYVYRVMGNHARYAYLSGASDWIDVDLALPKGLRAPEDAY